MYKMIITLLYVTYERVNPEFSSQETFFFFFFYFVYIYEMMNVH